jgi:hypothetical protein
LKRRGAIVRSVPAAACARLEAPVVGRDLEGLQGVDGKRIVNALGERGPDAGDGLEGAHRIERAA